jgi:hypothetical protein
MPKRESSRLKRQQEEVVREEVVTKVAVPEPVTEVVIEKTYTTTEPEVEIRKPATLAQALTERAAVVVKPKKKVRKVVERSTRRAS